MAVKLLKKTKYRPISSSFRKLELDSKLFDCFELKLELKKIKPEGALFFRARPPWGLGVAVGISQVTESGGPTTDANVREMVEMRANNNYWGNQCSRVER